MKKLQIKTLTWDSEFKDLEVGDRVHFILHMDRGFAGLVKESYYGQIIKVYRDGSINIEEIDEKNDVGFKTVWTRVNPRKNELIRQN